MLLRERVAPVAILTLAAIAMAYGWRLFWFLTDDAFIAFRYVANSRLGVGYVWNFPPFLPVEGYTSFLWVLLLDVVWRVTGVEPPAAANTLALGFAYGTLALTALMVWHLPDRAPLARWRPVWLAVVLAGVLSNRTFLAWSSSGLETAMFNFLFTLWLCCLLYLPLFSTRWTAGCAIATALLVLTRPDGYLMFAVTLVLVSAATLYSDRRPRQLLAAAPLLLVPLHLAWRYTTYQAWLPNTFYAKSGGAAQWESGARYLFAFMMEYSWWTWLLIALIAILSWAARWASPRARRDRPAASIATLPGRDIASHRNPHTLISVLVLATVALHAAYYTFWIGGDHFEFRVYSHLVPFLWVALIAMLNSVALSPPATLVAALLALGLSLPIPWQHWALTRDITTREQSGFLHVSVSETMAERYPWLPAPVIAYVRAYDDAEFWLIERAIGMRHQEHKVFQQWLSELMGPRPASLQRPDPQRQSIMLAGSVGVLAWRHGDVNVIDMLGLNDYVVARGDIQEGGFMAHNRIAPEGYFACFVDPPEPHKIVPITGERIRECEARFRARRSHLKACIGGCIPQATPYSHSPTNR